MLLTDVMIHDPVTVGDEAGLAGAMALMDIHGLAHLPVVRDGRLAGMVSAADILSATGWTIVGARVRSQDDEGPPVHVGEVMREPLRRRPRDTVTAESIERLLREHAAFAVVEEDQLTGIVTEIDVLGIVGEPGGLASAPTGDLMGPAAVVMPVEGTLGGALGLCRRGDVREVPVVEGSRLCGLVTAAAVRGALGRDRSLRTPVTEIMGAVPAAVAPDAPLSRAAELLRTHRLHALPVVAGEDLVGVLELAAVLERLLEALRTAGGIQSTGTGP